MSEQTKQLIKFAVNSRKGLRYEKNEDAYLVLPEFRIFAVADGMGGHNGGAVASNMLVDHIVGSLQRSKDQLDEKLILRLVKEANSLVFNRASKDSSLKGMGSTLSLVYFQESHGTLFHVGDSRIYRHLDFMAKQLTQDHTNDTHDLGLLSNKPRSQSGITRALGVRPAVKVDVQRFNHEDGAEYLIVSDGISDVLPLFEITNIVCDIGLSFSKRIEQLLEAADAKGGSDDKTAILMAP